jgi:ADP-ribose pyrophosphatase
MTPALEDQPESWPVTATTDLFRDDWVMALRRDELRAPGHEETFARWVLEHPGAVIVLAVDDERRAFCLWQYRHPAQRRFVELPAGLLDADHEEPVEAARRELREEAGLEAASWTPLGTTWSSPGISAEVMHFYLAQGLTEVSHDFERTHEEAEMTGGWVGLDDLLAAVLDGRVGDGPLVQALLLAQARGLLR